MGQSHPPFRRTEGRRTKGRRTKGRPIKGRRLIRGIRRWVTAAAGALALTAGLVAVGPPASAAGLTQVTGFGTNPGNLSMYTYAPDALPSGAPLVVALHGCTQSASDYYAHSGWPEWA
jgi:poly(3-hydroxybutyrate) depolymerase